LFFLEKRTTKRSRKKKYKKEVEKRSTKRSRKKKYKTNRMG
jgi:hypothetical protein